MTLHRPRREWERLTELVGYYVLTGYLKGELAQSLLLVGSPGTGKSSLILRFREAPRCRVVLDITVDGLRRNLLPAIKSKGYRTIIMPEFYKPFQRQAVTAQNMVGLLTACMSGEVSDMLVGPEGMNFAEIQIGVLGAMTPGVYSTWVNSLAAQGVLDRMSVLVFDFSAKERATIEDRMMREDKRDLLPVNWDWPRSEVNVRWDPKLRGELLLFAGEILTQDRNRLIQQLIALSKAIALHDGKRKVLKKHLRKLESYREFLKHIKPEQG